ncbi:MULTISPECIES: PAS domain S-box protein [Methylomonas]|uniref:PAS domain S-box-containing protein n=1 Tax=Methylomonas methanica TaxID=421 RepID=A0ABY2CHT9_METMH|nr:MULTISPECIES: PAS domain S-box protein [Methylomonas]TCV78203.1 PAS domain S-box-containing protein [Methylomonas methanica]
MSDLLKTASASLFLAVLDIQDICVMSTDSQGTIQMFNPAAERLLGYSQMEVMCQH